MSGLPDRFRSSWQEAGDDRLGRRTVARGDGELDQMLGQTAAERATALDALRARDPKLADDVARLLRDHESAQAGGFLEQGPDALLTTASAPDATSGPRPRSAAALPAGAELGGYRVRRVLGRGGMGLVYEAEEIESGRRVALKVLEQRFGDERERERFQREGRLAASINHEHCVFVFGAAEIHGVPAIAMELMQGTLADRLTAEGPLPPAAAVDVALQLVAGLQAAAAAGILHRDVKPSNCFVDADGVVKIGDFGISRSLRPAEETALSTRNQLAATPTYASPEQLRGATLDARADIYSLGATLYELVTGRRPFTAPDPMSLLMAVANDAPAPPHQVVPTVPRGLSRVILRCLAKRPEDRYASYAALAAALEPYASAVADARDARAALRRRRRRSHGRRRPEHTEHRPAGGADDDGADLASEPDEHGGIVHPAPPLLRRQRGAVGPNGREGTPRADARGRRRTPAAASRRVRPCAPLRRPEHPARLRRADDLGRRARGAVAERRPDQRVHADRPAADPVDAVRRGPAPERLRRPPRSGDWRSRGRAPRLERGRTGGKAPALHVATATVAGHRGSFAVLDGTIEGRPEWRPGLDERLRRPVWIRDVPAGTPPVAAARIALPRPTRLRWLAGRRTAQEAWDVYEGVAGVPMSQACRSPRSWSEVRQWLADLARELAAQQPGDHPPLDPDRVWILDSGRAKLLDDPTADAPATTSRLADGIGLLLAVAQRARTHSRQPWPLSATRFVDALADAPPASLSEMATSAEASLSDALRSRAAGGACRSPDWPRRQ